MLISLAGLNPHEFFEGRKAFGDFPYWEKTWESQLEVLESQ
jgi:hypothetical protein